MTEEEHDGGVGVADGATVAFVGRAKQQLAALTGRPADSVSGLARDGEGWRVSIDVVELERIPSSTDVLATYECELDTDGNLVGYERIRRYVRSQSDER